MIILLDFDGVVNISEYFSVQYEKDFGVSREVISEFFIKDFNKCAIAEKEIKDVLSSYIKKWNWKDDVDALLDYWFRNDICLNRELLAYVQSLDRSEHYVALASQQEINRRNHIWEDLGLKEIFDAFYCTCDIGFLKSDTMFYTKILQDLEQKHLINSPEDVLFFDDSTKFVNTAKEIGIDAFCFQNNSMIYKVLMNRST